MGIVIAIVLTLIFDWGIGAIISHYRKKGKERDEEEFQEELERILTNTNLSGDDRKYAALELCRKTEGEMAAGAYFALYDSELAD